MQLIEINKQTWVIQGRATIGILAYVGRSLSNHLSTDIRVGLMSLTTLKQRPGTFKHIVAGHGEVYCGAWAAQINSKREEWYNLLPHKI